MTEPMDVATGARKMFDKRYQPTLFVLSVLVALLLILFSTFNYFQEKADAMVDDRISRSAGVKLDDHDKRLAKVEADTSVLHDKIDDISGDVKAVRALLETRNK